MDVLITGGLGYAGSILIKKLLDNGHSVTVIDNKRFGDDHINEFEGGLDIIEKDVRDVESYKEDLDRADVVVHLAALSKEPTSLYNTKYCIDTNYLSTKKLVDYLKGKDKKFIYASSTSVYFTYDIVKEPEEYKEDKELNPISPYSIT